MTRAATWKQVLPVLGFAAGRLDQDVSLAALAEQARLSPFHLHRVFAATAGETPKQFTLRLRLGRAAAMLLTGDDSVLDIALACGFGSHEAFCRAFRARFRMTPSAYRARGFAAITSAEQSKTHAQMVDTIGPCIGLFHIHEDRRPADNRMTYSITRKELAPQPVLLVRRRVKRPDIAATIGQSLPLIFVHAQQHGIALAGLPFTRYTEMGPGMVTMEPGMRVTSPAPSGAGEIVADLLPGGPVAATVHAGPYDKLTEAYAAIEQWIAAEGLTPGGAPWEAYLNDPGDFPDPKDWKTEVFWPLAR